MRKIVLFLFLGLFLFFLPQICSRGWIKKQVEAHLAQQLGGDVTIGKLSLSWQKKQQCYQVQWINSENGIVLFADQVSVFASLFGCIQFKEKPLNVFVEGAEMHSQANFRFIKKKKEKELTIHFSPIEARVAKGLITFKKFQLNINEKMQVSTWGQIDLGKHHIDAILALPPQTLKKVFKEAKNLPDDFLLEIPISTQLTGKALEKSLLSFFIKNYAKVTSLHK